MSKYRVTAGLGRLTNHHVETFVIEATSEDEAVRKGVSYYDALVQDRLKDDPIRGKFTTVSNVELISE